jgi:hypothetical protein
VKKVMANSVIYAALLDGKAPSLKAASAPSRRAPAATSPAWAARRRAGLGPPNKGIFRAGEGGGNP